MWTPTPLPWRPVLVPCHAPLWAFACEDVERYDAGLNLPGGVDLPVGKKVLWAV